MSLHVVVTEQEINIAIRGLDQCWALRRSVVIPTSTVRQATVVDPGEAKARLRFRLLGSGLPGVLIAGRFTVRDAPGDREFWVTHRGSTFLQIETTDPKLRHVVLDVPDGERLVREINQSLAA